MVRQAVNAKAPPDMRKHARRRFFANGEWEMGNGELSYPLPRLIIEGGSSYSISHFPFEISHYSSSLIPSNARFTCAGNGTPMRAAFSSTLKPSLAM